MAHRLRITADAPPPTLAGLLTLDDAAFVQAAYRLLLQRDPDPQGFTTGLDLLATGTSRLVWLQALRDSPEGRLRRVRLDGLDDAPYGPARVAATLPAGQQAGPGHDHGAPLRVLLQRDGTDFVQHAYALLLGRPADATGQAHYCARLQAGISRRQIVAEIASSEEFSRRNRHVDGLEPILRRHRRLQNSLGRAALGMARRLRGLWPDAVRNATPAGTLPLPAAPTPPGRAVARLDGPAATSDTTPPASQPSALPDTHPVRQAHQWLLTQPPLQDRAPWPAASRPAGQRHAAVTIVSKNYLAFARTLAASYRQHHPDHDVIVVLVDKADGLVSQVLDCGAQVVEIAAFEVPDLAQMLYRYSIMELNTAVKPFVLDDLFRRRGYDTLLYLDPDIQVYQPLQVVHAALRQASVVLTPHMRRPCFDDALPSDTTILQSGTYNLGFIGLRRGETSQRLLDWWKTKLYAHCVVDIANGLFVDQKWIDLVPGFFPDHAILYHPGCNAAYWNLHERPISRSDDGRWLADGQPLMFFHFSGYLPYAPGTLSRHQNRHCLADLPPVQALTDAYAAALGAQGYAETCRWAYAFATLPNGVTLSLDLVVVATRWANAQGMELPCPITDPERFCSVLMARGLVPERPQAVLLFDGLLRLRPDVAAAFPGCVDDHDHAGFRAWIASSGVRDYKLQALLAFEGAPPDAPAAGEGRAGVQRILHLYFLRSDLQAEFPDLQSAAGLQAWLAWMRLHRHGLRLRQDEITQFGTWARTAGPLLSQAAFLYRHDGQPRRLQPGPATLDERRREINSPLDAAALIAGLAPTAAWAAPPAVGLEAAPVNVAGFLQAPTGMGESARSLVASLAQAGCTTRCMDLPHPSSQQDGPPTDPLLFGWHAADAAVSITVANADSSALLQSFLPPGFWGRQRVGYWVWETEILPAPQAAAHRLFDALWAPSQHAARAIAAGTGRAVQVLPHTLDLAGIDTARADRPAFGLPADGLLFGFAFDPDSVLERKNVRGLVEAFEAAFRADDNCWLVLKVNGRGQQSYDFQEALARVHSDRVLVTRQVLGRSATFGFLRTLDAYVSLHRCEGFGLTCAEAMACGVPVVASGYSGNLDFMHEGNSLLVPAPVVQTDRPHGPYPAGTRWGQPDHEAAVQALRALLSAQQRQQLGAAGRDSVRRQLAPATVGRQLKALLTDLTINPARPVRA